MAGTSVRLGRAGSRGATGWLPLALGLLSVACGGDAADGATPGAAPGQDVVLIVIDTLRADHLGCYGYERDTSPTLDALAARGVRVADATSQSSWTGPSMVSMFQGRHVVGDFVRMPAAPTLAERLAEAGYRTVGFQDNVLLEPGTGYDRGFELYAMEAGPAVIIPALNNDDPRPLFAYFHFVDPHDPYAPRPSYDIFEPEPLPDEQRARFEGLVRERHPEWSDEQVAAETTRLADHVSREVALYDGDVRQGDGRVQWVLDALERARRLDDALIVVAADHGEGLWQHRKPPGALPQGEATPLLESFKATHRALLYEELTRVPLILAGPDLPEGAVLEGPVANVDILPTVFDLVGLPVPGGLDGRSLVPELRALARGERAVVPERPLFSDAELYSAVRTGGRHKLLLPWDGNDPLERFDLERDPGEVRDLAADDPEGAPSLADMQRLLERLRAEALHPEAGEDAVTAEVRARLEALGYVGN